MTRIETIQILPFGMLNAFLLINKSGAILVDTGLPNSEGRVEKVLYRSGLGWADIKLIVLTHAHVDHAGSAAQIRKLTGAPILAHEFELPYLHGEPPVLRPTGLFGRLFQRTGAMEQKFDCVTPDILVSKPTYDLSGFGFPSGVIYTPGHTPGSISVQVDSGRVIAGDLVASGILLGGIVLKGKPKPPPFELDTLEVSQSLRCLLDLGMTKFYLGHGGPLDASQVGKHIVSISARSNGKQPI